MSEFEAKETYDIVDLEKNFPSTQTSEKVFTENGSLSVEEQFSVDNTKAAKLVIFSNLINRLNAETNGIDPISDEDKTEGSVLNATTMWFSANLVLSAYAVGALGPLAFGLNFGTSVLTVVFFNILGVLPVAFFSLFGPELGLRQMILSRFLTGNITGRIFSLFNCVACVGWCVLNTIVAAQLLNMVNEGGHQLPLWAGCLVIISGTVLVTFFGFKIIHAYEKWSWVPNFAVFLIIIARLKMSGKFSGGEWTSGSTTAGNVLSFGCAAFGYAAAWATYAADYTVYMPRDSNKFKIFFSLVAGLIFPLCFTMILGAACAMGAVNDPVWKQYYDTNAMGGLTYAILVPNSLHGFGDFCCVLLALSTIANNIPNMYTIALSVQAFWEPLAKIPRALWSVAGNATALGIAIPACYYFESFLEKFMNTIAYYAAIYICLSCAEHFVFRRSIKAYNVEDWNDPSKLPVGIAGCAGLIVGAFGVALGMCQSYWVGEIARLIGKSGGDIGFELGGGWAFITYVVVRFLELKYIGR
ncbi:cytosine permease NDAI_0E04320 [Naumovozyma dairenensis CBS 421]|uniref:Purine-cytosine permease n=1 Tax=Naumovozyma dairenensis (strain ATCC 10597 / BCRC 20456 / CBS 421 / NBRC 0211 / NRRL Y-12639) TaxID=1071378 RepID=G0WBX9_NAUDC|nr:hypothetical protein NDAI_0E04320 [Naumovozyma dairenensis CBS 421]CCD25249.1 hypothetical protein NDAI_0E04320 [Naumovozyma dairenensis CBS 421]